MAANAADLEAGTIVRRAGTEYQVVDDPALGTVMTEIGDRELTPEQVPDVGDDCLRPDCDGHVEDVNGKRWCSEGCLEWIRTTPQEGDPCDRYGDRCDGTLQMVGDLEWECDTCSCRRSSSQITWREAWLPEFMRSDEDGGSDA